MNQQKFTTAEKLNTFQPSNAVVNFYSDPGLRARAFTVKFLVACVPLGLVTVGVTWMFDQPLPFALVMFGALAIVTYFELSDHESKQSPEWLERNRQNISLQAHRYEVDNATSVEKLQIQLADALRENKRINQRLLTMRALGEEKNNYVPASEGDPSPWPDDFEPSDVVAEVAQMVDAATQPDAAVEVLIDFVADLYKHPAECLLADGRTIDVKATNGLPWSTRSGNPPDVIRQMKAIIGGMPTRLLIEESGGRVWRLNLDAYPTLEDALKVLERA